MRLKASAQLAALAACGAMAGHATAEPYHPDRDEQVIERLPAGLSFDRRQALRLQQDPRRIEPAVAAAREYLLEARATSDARFEGYAQAALGPWWNLPDAPTDVLLLRAALHERRHDFTSALTDLDRILAREPQHGQAWLSRGSILQVRGEYNLSLQACHQLPAAASRLVRAACIAGAAGLQAGGDAALAALRTALRQSQGEAPETLAWAEAVRADVAMAQGRDAEAEAAFRNGLRFDLANAYLRWSFADFLIDRDRRSEALTLIDPGSSAVELSLRRARALPPNDTETDAIRMRLEAVFAATRQRGDPPHLRSEAYFRLFVTGEPERAVALARANFDEQREPFDVRLLLEAALSSEQYEVAQPAVDWLADAGVEHVQLAELVHRLQAGPP